MLAEKLHLLQQCQQLVEKYFPGAEYQLELDCRWKSGKLWWCYVNFTWDGDEQVTGLDGSIEDPAVFEHELSVRANFIRSNS